MKPRTGPDGQDSVTAGIRLSRLRGRKGLWQAPTQAGQNVGKGSLCEGVFALIPTLQWAIKAQPLKLSSKYYTPMASRVVPAVERKVRKVLTMAATLSLDGEELFFRVPDTCPGLLQPAFKFVKLLVQLVPQHHQDDRSR
ncbi:hypothetical protein BO98_00980 [Candidatus Synechococcus spongiarum LMB bulk10D]|nr:hypothetical protein BO98_00980 [Candidatus Synechococcus spongiarum LMB bulk10D]